MADAVAYAHQQGVLHRDLKPGNLLVDTAGQVRLTDFGLVKHIDEPGITRTGDLVGTPQYMPPESLEGQYDARSEVYGLGLTLYELLALRPAFPARSAADWTRTRGDRTAVALRSVLPAASPDLQRVVHKALAVVPSERYGTVAAFRDDLRCLLEDRAISIRRPGLPEEIVRWARRNPTAAALAGSCVVLLMLVAISTTLGYTITQQAYRELSRQHEQLMWQQTQTEAARQMAETARELAVDNQRRMADEYRRAEANLQTSMDAMDAMFVQIIAKGQQPAAVDANSPALTLDWDGLNELAGVQTALTAADAAFLTDMLQFYHQIARQNADSTELQWQSGRAYRRVANSYYLIGDWPRAIEAYQEASKIFQRLWEAEPTSETLLLVVAQVRNEAGQAVRRQGDQAAAIRLHQSAIKLMQDSPLAEQPAVQLEIARSLNGLCTAETGIVGEAQRIPTSVVEDYFGLQRNRRPGLGNLTRMANRRNDNLTRRQREWLTQAIAITDRLLQVDPENAEVRLVRAKSHRGLAVLVDPAAQPAEFRQLIDDAIHQIEQLHAKHPTHPQYAYSLALTYTIPLALDDAAATDYLAKAAQLTRRLCLQYPQNMEFQQLNSNVHVEWAKLLFEQESDEDGLEALDTAAASLSHLVQTAPNLAYFRWEYANVSMAMSQKLLAKNMGRRAAMVLERAIAEGRAAEEKVPLRGRIKALDIQQHQVLAEIYQATNNRLGIQRVNRELRRLRTGPG
jgi:tetratricopeptide (TPR) repeat protein